MGALFFVHVRVGDAVEDAFGVWGAWVRYTGNGPHEEGGGVVVVWERGGDFTVEVRAGDWHRGGVVVRKCGLGLGGLILCFLVLAFMAEHCGSGGGAALLYSNLVRGARAMGGGEGIERGAVGLGSGWE